MKKYTKIIAGVGLLIGVLYSCQKDVEVLNNTDTSWEVDKKISEADIRTRIGYDPRFSYVYVNSVAPTIVPLNLGEVKITKTHTGQIVLGLTDPVQKDVKISLEYDAALYETIKNDYIGYELGEESLMKFTQGTQTITAGETAATFEITAENPFQFTQKSILPYSLKIVEGDDVIHLFEDQKQKSVIIKVEPKDVVVTASPETASRGALKDNTGTVTMRNKRLSFTIASSDLLPEDISFGFVRNNAHSPESGSKLALADMEKNLVKVNFGSSQTGLIEFELENTDGLDMGKYELPLKLVAYDASGKTYDLGKEVLIYITVRDTSTALPNGNNVVSYTGEDKALGNKIGSKSSWSIKTLSGNVNSIASMIDSDYSREGYFRGNSSPTIELSLGDVHTVTSLVFTSSTGSYSLTGLKVYATNTDTGEEKVLQGQATFAEKAGKLVVNFDQPIMVDKLIFDTFTGMSWVDIFEIDVYEQ